MTNPQVSICMPVYNCEKTLAQAIRSILLQTFQDWELLIIDDGSADNTVGIAQGFGDPRIRVLADGKHTGLPERLNAGIMESRGSYIARMDGDDVSYPCRLERQHSYMKEHQEVHLVGSAILVFNSEGVAIGKRARSKIPRHVWECLFRTIPIPHPTFFGRREWFCEHGYALWPLHHQDQRLLMATLSKCELRVLPEILLGYRETGLHIRKQMRYRLDYLKTVKQLSRSTGPFFAVSLMSVQMFKLALDLFAISSGLKYRLLRHRAASLGSLEVAEWSQVWQAVSFPVRQDPQLGTVMAGA